VGQKWAMMSQKEAQRLTVVQRVGNGDLSQAQAGALLGVSVRQVKRLCRRVREQGPAGLISLKRGIASNRRIGHEVREHFMALVRQHYADFGPELAREYLAGEHGFGYSTETLRGWMVHEGLWKAKVRRAKRVHSPRPRRSCLGELVQIDGSHHDWFEGRAAKCCLIAFIDDATGRVLGARFTAQETTEGYLAVLREVVGQHGAPLALYSDRHGIFTKSDPEDPKPTQFERALLQLHIEPICAHSPQAKGRVERLFQTLQDRMCKALRLAGVADMDDANAWLQAYLRQHNQRFAVPAREQADMHRPWLGTAKALSEICALHYQRHLSAQGACRFEGQILQLEPGQADAPKARAKIDIAQHADGHLDLSYRGKPLRHRAFACHNHLSGSKLADAKTINGKIEPLRKPTDPERTRIARLKAELDFQSSQRAKGIYRPDTPPIVPPRVSRQLRATPCAAG
jgi:transposase